MADGRLRGEGCRLRPFPIVKGQYAQGLLAIYDKEQRVYVVTVIPEQENAIHDRWPKIILDYV